MCNLFLFLCTVLFFLNTHQIFCVGVKVSARNCKVRIYLGSMCFGILPTAGKISKPENSDSEGLMIHGWKLFRNVCFLFILVMGCFLLFPIFCRWSMLFNFQTLPSALIQGSYLSSPYISNYRELYISCMFSLHPHTFKLQLQSCNRIKDLHECK